MVGAKTGRLNGRDVECRGPLPPGPFSASSTVNTHTQRLGSVLLTPIVITTAGL